MRLTILLCLLCMGTIAFANNGEFSYDSEKVNSSLSALNNLEAMHHASPNVSFDDLIQDARFEGISIDKGTVYGHANSGDLPVLPAFWWGCILGVIGILIVYLITEDSSQTQSALWGFLIGWGAGCILYVLIWVWIVGNTFWFLGG